MQTFQEMVQNLCFAFGKTFSVGPKYRTVPEPWEIPIALLSFYSFKHTVSASGAHSFPWHSGSSEDWFWNLKTELDMKKWIGQSSKQCEHQGCSEMGCATSSLHRWTLRRFRKTQFESVSIHIWICFEDEKQMVVWFFCLLVCFLFCFVCLYIEHLVKRLKYFTAAHVERCLKGSNTTMVIHVQLAFQSSTFLQHAEAWQSCMGYCLVIWKNEHGKPLMFNLHVFIFSRLQYFFLIFLFYSLSLSFYL